jgi:hypothetical protein
MKKSHVLGVVLILGCLTIGQVANVPTVDAQTPVADKVYSITWPLGKAWVHPGGTVTDNYDGTIPWANVVITGTVDVTKVNTSSIWHSVKDSSGNEGTAQLLVYVKDTTKPVISLTGCATVSK